MKEENKRASKWSQITRKKWFFPTLYLAVAAILLTVVVWYQNVDKQISDTTQQPDTEASDLPNSFGDDVQAVMDQQETIKMPIRDLEQAEIVTKFYDYNADKKDKELALVLYNNRYYQSTGIDIAASDGSAFEVLASLSGTVAEVKEDPVLGMVVHLEHENDVTTYYASLGDVQVKAGDKVKQGETIAKAGKNLFGKDLGNYLHFELRKDGKTVNPETFFNQPVSKLDAVQADEASQEQESQESAENEEAPEDAEQTQDESDASEEEPVENEEPAEGEEQEEPVEDEATDTPEQ
ncbi:M23 family metallopeptidase [Ornithinibacillus gellani]|uniref:M23 family metallopeptidase n=1 Tax=Ornithinibacillus gellani TaxID=2293253 RepID=UPI000F487ED5|nr:M23 family metallopeptidase [Ornithinibacillus gellani]TQS72180.1 M23 family metallopeptidase [Ornithinibacillus gellani]